MEKGRSKVPFVDNRPEAARLKRLQEMANDSPQSKNAARLQAIIDNSSPVVAQRRRVERRSGRAARRGEGTTEDEPLSELEKRLDQTEQTFRILIKGARTIGWDVAADNLQRYMAGTGGTEPHEVSWLRGFSAVTTAEQVHQGHFESLLDDLAYNMSDGETRQLSVEKFSVIIGSQLTELYWASGESKFRSEGNFALTRDGKLITISGTAEHHWRDCYDWHVGLGVWIPGFGTISDEEALLLKQHRNAEFFGMEADWTQSVQGSTNIVRDSDEAVTITSDYTWSAP